MRPIRGSRGADRQDLSERQMDAFETVVAAILQRLSYWTATGFKVELTKEEKRQVGRHSTPRWELDVVGYSGRQNEVFVVECKSFLDSRGVCCDAFDGTNPDAEKRYKLFSEETLRQVVLDRLRIQLFATGLCPSDARIVLGLAAGKIYGDEDWLRNHFESRGWRLWTPSFIREQLYGLRDSGYDNSVAAVVAKLLLREPQKNSRERTAG